MQKNRSFTNTEQQRSTRLQASPCTCPYWAAEEKACSLVKEGLFLPTEAHFSTYCTSPHFSFCDHYQRLAPPPEIPALPDQHPANRRRSVRVPQRMIFRFSVIGGTEHPAITRQEESWTLDISEGGLCFASRRRLTPDTMIRFSVEGENEFGMGRGQGRVVWFGGVGNTGLFGCGVEILG